MTPQDSISGTLTTTKEYIYTLHRLKLLEILEKAGYKVDDSTQITIMIEGSTLEINNHGRGHMKVVTKEVTSKDIVMVKEDGP